MSIIVSSRYVGERVARQELRIPGSFLRLEEALGHGDVQEHDHPKGMDHGVWSLQLVDSWHVRHAQKMTIERRVSTPARSFLPP